MSENVVFLGVGVYLFIQPIKCNLRLARVVFPSPYVQRF